MNLWKKSFPRVTAMLCSSIAVVVFLAAIPAHAQSLSVLPVNVFLQPGERAATLTITNSGPKPTSVQIRAYDWTQKDGEDQLTDSEGVILSPPLANIEPGASQVIRLILRKPAETTECTYRVILDQIPGPGEAGVVQMVLRLSIPIFAAPPAKPQPLLDYRLESKDEKFYLVASNTGQSHEVLRDLVLTTADGKQLMPAARLSPYLLSGSTRRWELDTQGYKPLPDEALKLTANGINGPIDQQVKPTPVK